MVDPPVKLASIQSSEVEFEKMLADIALVGTPAFGAIGMASDSTGGGSGMVELVGCIALTVAVLVGRGNGVEGWMAEVTPPFGRSTGWVSGSDGLSKS